MMFTLSTLLLAENVLSQYTETPRASQYTETPRAQGMPKRFRPFGRFPTMPKRFRNIRRFGRRGNLRGNSLANELSSAIAGATLGELKKLGTEKSIGNLKTFVADQILDKKLGMMEKRLEEGIEQKLEEHLLLIGSAAPAVSIEEQEKDLANELIDQSPPVDPNASPELAKLEKDIEHIISNTVIKTITELKMKADAGKIVSLEEEQQILGQHIIANVLETFPNASEEKRAALAVAIKEAYENMGKGKGPSSQRRLFLPFLQGLIQQLPAILQNTPALLQNVQQVVNPILATQSAETQQVVGTALDTAIEITSNPAVQASIQQIVNTFPQPSQGQ